VVLAAAQIPVASAPEPTPVESAKPDKPSAKQTKAEAKAAIKAKTKTQASTPSKSTTPSPADKKFYVNVGLFADANNARNAYTKLIDAGLLAIQHEVNGKRGQFTRVQVGPFETQGEAERAADKVRGLNLDAIVQKP
jgi:DedD protein